MKKMDPFDVQIGKLARDIEEDLQAGELNFPTMFDLSLRIKKLADDPSSSLNDLLPVVRSEPLLSARVLKTANSALLNPSGKEITSISAAIGRIGMSSLRCLAFAVAADQITLDQRSPSLRLLASGLWLYSVDVAAWSYAFARHLSIATADKAMLAGLMVNIGQFYLLAKASQYDALQDQISRFAEFVLLWDEPIKRAVLQALAMPADIIDAAAVGMDSGDSGQPPWPPATLGDLVFLATLAVDSPDPFADLLGIEHRPELLAAFLGEDGREEFDALVGEARQVRQQLLAAIKA